MKKILLIAIIVILLCLPCMAELFPYPVKENGQVSAQMLSFLKESTSDIDLMEINPDGKSWRVNFDKQRKEFKVIGICSYPEGTFNQINEKAKEEIYTPRFMSKSTEPYIKGLAVHSGHFTDDGIEVFVPFHYLVYPNGDEMKVFSEPLIKIDGTLKINQVPWAMGNWTINCQSITIGALGDGNLTPDQVKTIRKRISSLQDIKSDVEVKSRLAEDQTNLIT